MKNFFSILFLCCLFVVTGSLSAQNFSPTFGIKAGVNYSTLAVDEDEIDDATYKTGFTAGFYKITPISDNLSFQSELLYTAKGAEYEVTGRNVEANLGYLEVPLSLQLHLGKLPVYVFGGAHASYLLNAKYEYASGFFEDGQDIVEFDDLDGFKRFEFGVQGGVGVQIGKLSVEARLTRGLSNMESDRTINALPLEANNTKNFGAQLTVGIGF